MIHTAITPCGDLASLLHRLDARTKLLAALTLIVVCVSTPPAAWPAFAGYLALLLSASVLGRLPLLFVLRRSLVVLPFVLAMAIFIPFTRGHGGGSDNLGVAGLTVSRGGLLIFWNVLIKAWVGVWAMILLTSTTEFPRILAGFEQLGAPRLLVMMTGFTYRYIFVLVEEALRMKRAGEARGYRGAWLWQARTIGHLIGTLFLRSYERGERVYQAMLARGFDGGVMTFARTRLTALDYLSGLGVAALLILLRVASS